MTEQVTVLYIGAWQEWGHDSGTDVGTDLRLRERRGASKSMGRRGLLENERCGCGQPFYSCAFWRAVGEEAFGGWENVDVDKMVEFGPHVERRRYTPRYALAAKTNVRSRKVNTLLEECGPILERLYRAIQMVSGAGVIVDSSKRFSCAVLLSLLPLANLRVVHVVRDSMAVAYSWRRTKESPAVVGGRLMPWMSPAQASRAWSIQNYPYAFFSGLAHLSRLRHEDFVSNPTVYLAQTLVRVGFDDEADRLPDVIRGRQISLSIDHTVSGNPVRFRTGSGELQPDEEWKVKMRGADKNIVAVLTAPLLLKYGYFREK